MKPNWVVVLQIFPPYSRDRDNHGGEHGVRPDISSLYDLQENDVRVKQII